MRVPGFGGASRAPPAPQLLPDGIPLELPRPLLGVSRSLAVPQCPRRPMAAKPLPTQPGGSSGREGRGSQPGSTGNAGKCSSSRGSPPSAPAMLHCPRNWGHPCFPRPGLGIWPISPNCYSREELLTFCPPAQRPQGTAGTRRVTSLSPGHPIPCPVSFCRSWGCGLGGGTELCRGTRSPQEPTQDTAAISWPQDPQNLRAARDICALKRKYHPPAGGQEKGANSRKEASR